MDNMIVGDYIGVVYTTELTVTKNPNGEWLAVQKVTQKRSDDLEAWDERTVDFEAKHRNVDQAVAEAAVLATLYLESINYDLFVIETDLKEGEYLQ